MKQSFTYLLGAAPFAGSCQKIILDENGVAVDYEYICVNRAFERLTGISQEKVSGLKASIVTPGSISLSKKHLDIFADVALHGQCATLMHFHPETKSWYNVYIYSPETQYFIMLYTPQDQRQKCSNDVGEKRSEEQTRPGDDVLFAIPEPSQSESPQVKLASELASKRNATDRERAERAMRKSETLLRTIIDNIPINIYVKDRNSRKVLANRAELEYLGLSNEDEVLEKHDCELYPNIMALNSLEEDREVLEYGKSILQRETSYVKENGETSWSIISKLPLRNEEDEIVGLVGISIDITDRKRDELAMITAKEQAEVANKAKSVFLANMSHEIRTPLNGVIGFADLLSRTTLTSEQQEYVQNVNTAGRSLLDVINNVLDLSKIEAGKLDLEIRRSNIRRLCRKAADIIQYQARQKEILLYTKVDENVPSHAYVDTVRLNQVLVNLLGNAVKFTDSGSVTLNVSFQEDDEDSTQGEFTFSIIDTGIGIEKKQRDHLFEAFAQADTSTTRRYGGTGLGLSISSMLVQKMGGQIHVDSERGKGSTFSFSIHTKYEFASGVERTSEMSGKVVNEVLQSEYAPVVLIAEDIPMNMLLTRTLLLQCVPDAKVLEAVNGKQAVELFDQHEVDMILMDVQMPEMDGLAATRAIRNLEKPGQRTPIVALTAGALAEERKNCISSGMDDFMSKPIEKKTLFKLVERMLPILSED